MAPLEMSLQVTYDYWRRTFAHQPPRANGTQRETKRYRLVRLHVQG